MIESQLMPCGVVSPAVATAFRTVAREDFVAADRRGVAYVDSEQPMGEGRMLMAPLSIGRLVEAAGIRPADRVLVVAAGTGYAAALVAAMGATVVALEDNAALAAVARANLARWPNASVVEGNLPEGHAALAPYSLILVDGAVDELPQSLIAQLAEGGRVAAIVTGADRVSRAAIGRKAGAILRFDPFAEAGAPPLPQFGKPKGFQF